MTKRIRIKITPKIIEQLRYEKNRTGLGGRALLNGKRGEYPEGLSGIMIDTWRYGTTRSAKHEHLEWVLEAYTKWQPPHPAEPKPQKITLTDKHYAYLKSEVARTGLGARDILRHAPKPLPEGLNHQKLQRWISEHTKTAIKTHWEYVLRLYETIGDENKVN